MLGLIGWKGLASQRIAGCWWPGKKENLRK